MYASRSPLSAAVQFRRISHDVRSRCVEVKKSTRLTPGLLRIEFTGEDLSDFHTLGFDDHVNVSAEGPSGKKESRFYTPRRFDRKQRLLVIDFALHEDGPMTQWALGANIGDRLRVTGPKRSMLVSPVPCRWLVIADETALPAVGRLIEEANAHTSITSVVAVSGPLEEQTFNTACNHSAIWVHRSLSNAANPAPLITKLETVSLEPDTFVWIAAEGAVARAVRLHLAEQEGQRASWMKASGYWLKGHANRHERLG